MIFIRRGGPPNLINALLVLTIVVASDPLLTANWFHKCSFCHNLYKELKSSTMDIKLSGRNPFVWEINCGRFDGVVLKSPLPICSNDE